MSTPKIEILVGAPGSGKSFYSKSKEGVRRISQDEMGKEGHLEIFQKALAAKESIIVDRMDFDTSQRARYLDPAKKAGYETSIVVLETPRKICFDRCLARKDHETVKTEDDARKAINFFFGHYAKPLSTEADSITFLPYQAKEKPKAILCDLDGTLCNIAHRKDFVKKEAGKKANWSAFFKLMAHDELNVWCAEILKRFAGDHEIVFCSGRPEEYREVTEAWLRKHEVYFGHLFMRSSGDYRADNIAKEIILDFDVLPQFDPMFVIDDRQQVVDMWRRRGITCLQCAPGNF